MDNIILKTKKFFQERVKKYGEDRPGYPDPFGLLKHVEEVAKWADFLCDKNKDADREVVMLSVWLHDVGHYPLPTKIDHAARGQRLAKQFLSQEKYDSSKIQQVLHCVRSHRCKDIMPQTIEAKIIACADSASHFTDSMYMDMAKDDKKAKVPLRVYGKIERDYRDASIFPGVKKSLTPLYMAWKKLISEYEKIDLSK